MDSRRSGETPQGGLLRAQRGQRWSILRALVADGLYASFFLLHIAFGVLPIFHDQLCAVAPCGFDLLRLISADPLSSFTSFLQYGRDAVESSLSLAFSSLISVFSGHTALWLAFFLFLVWSGFQGPSSRVAIQRREEEDFIKHDVSPPTPLSTLERVRQQLSLLRLVGTLPVLSAHEEWLQWGGAALYTIWAVVFANRPQHLFHLLIIMHILFNSKGKWASLSSTFKYDGNKMYPVALLFGFRLFGLLSDSLRYDYASSGLSAAVRSLIFLHETDAKMGHAAHMTFVYASVVVDGWDLFRTRSGVSAEVYWSLLCGAVYVLCDSWTSLREMRVRRLIRAAWEKFNDDIFPDRDVEYVDILQPSASGHSPKAVRLYFNLSHYDVHRTFSAVAVLCEMVLLSSALR